MSVVKLKPTKPLQSITKDTCDPVKNSKLEANTRRRDDVRENVC